MTPRGSAKDNQDGLSTPTPAKWVKPLNTLQCRNIIGKHMELETIALLVEHSCNKRLNVGRQVGWLAMVAAKLLFVLVRAGLINGKEVRWIIE
jgi:hypothetical protein